MAEIINYNPQDNPRLNEIYEILLLAGYFRIRIASLKAFDKVIGGLAWCITSSNFEIELQYNDEMQIGQKIKVSEKICDSLKKMKCPYDLQPFQLQGLDVNNIFPIIQWLVKFVYETRFERQKYDRQLSMFLGKVITRLQNVGNPQKIPEIEIKRTRINKAIQKTSFSNPLRVYSALLEYNDPTSMKMYNKLLNIQANQKKKKNKQQNIANYLMEEEEENRMSNMQNEMNQFGGVNKLSLNKLEKIIEDNRQHLEKGVKEEIDEGSPETISDLRQDLGIKAQSHTQEGKSRINNDISEEQKILKQAKIINDKYLQKIQTIETQLQSYEAMETQLAKQIHKLQKKNDKAHRITTQQIQKNQEYIDFEAQAKEEINKKKSKVNNRLEKLVEKRQKLKIMKGELKKKAKQRIEQLQYEKNMVEASVPEIDQEAFGQMMKQAELKKQIYNKKYEELTILNQELAILQRKAQKYTSAPEVAQYHQRFIQLFECINVLIEDKRSYYSEISNLEAEKKIIRNYLDIMNNMRDSYKAIKKKAALKQFVDDTKDTIEGLQANLKNSQITLAKIEGKRQSVYGQLMDLIKLEREYLTLLRQLKLEYENVAKNMK